ncbi:acetyl-CoA acetyltransferase [Rhizobium grahamii CCGE 502]|uniref:Acetyl-CoA acetyltransferase n=1 Tax=Rhizobium grahamii CCGE 502 TaxID=990285 RepID=S3HVH4_9HYPH|nr:acetyl-CoA acetyltransferase [Rhizobium grahamii CCGE 502]
MRTAFRPGGPITACNAPGLNRAVAAMIVAERAVAEAKGIRPIGRIAGSPEWSPACVGWVPFLRCARHWQERAGAFPTSSASRATRPSPPCLSRSPGSWGCSEDIVNDEGGAIAHGHPIGAIGAILVTRFLHAMKRENLRQNR